MRKRNLVEVIRAVVKSVPAPIFVLYLSALCAGAVECATHTHQLSLDMQLSLVAPLLVYLLFVSQGWGILLLLTLHVISGALRYYVSVQNNLSMLIYIGITLNQSFRTANMSYTVPSHQATPYLFGIWLGYFLHKNDSKIHIPKVVCHSHPSAVRGHATVAGSTSSGIPSVRQPGLGYLTAPDVLLLLTLHVISGALRYYVSVQNNLSMLIYSGMT
uniref:Acyltransferase 3 domain-containing protein n=1 Tax=Timema douglasi TaxID=61478 RepID=A0A7R8VKX6_TIMDO|nr:unnamed protein product [Timema douglasi]